MRIRKLHSWDVSIPQAKEIQLKLRKRLIHKPLKNVRTVAACDVSYSDDYAYGVVVVFSYPNLRQEAKPLDVARGKAKVGFPYVPGYLTFREGPVLMKAFAKLKIKPDVVLFDGQGIAHPRRMGEAAHLGLLLNLPSIGCAKSRLYGDFKDPGKKKGSYSYLIAKGEKVGVALRTREETKPIFLSPGHKIDLRSSIEIVMNCVTKYRVPEPLRMAHAESTKR